ncbi:MAG: DNA repair protein RecO [Oscillibacter sp.]|nr:DNA repair protein RecO [Oscillibacter sp.]
MARERTVVKGIVLRAVDTKESDRILTILTPGGKLPVVAKGARSRKSRVTACTQLLVYAEFTLSESRGWQYLSEGNTIELFDGVRRDVGLLSLASYFAELTEAVALEDTESGEVLSLLLNALYALGTLKKPQALVKAAFELKLMSLTGFEPLADACACCGSPEPENPMLDLREGVVCCGKCGGPPRAAAAGPADRWSARGLSMPLSSGALAALRHVLYGEAKRLYSFSLAAEDLKRLGDASEAYVHATLERGFGTLDFYKGLQIQGAEG